MDSVMAEEINVNDRSKNKGVKIPNLYNNQMNNQYFNKGGLPYDPNSIHNVMISHLL